MFSALCSSSLCSVLSVLVLCGSVLYVIVLCGSALHVLVPYLSVLYVLMLCGHCVFQRLCGLCRLTLALIQCCSGAVPMLICRGSGGCSGTVPGLRWGSSGVDPVLIQC